MTSSAAAALVALLDRDRLQAAVAESLTGGAVSASIVAVPGASRILRGGVTAYHSDVKVAVLGVEQSVIDAYGVVSPQVAAAMAAGVSRLLRADLAIATTGVAGPGSSGGVPAGTVVVAVLYRGEVVTRRVVLGGNREAVRRGATGLALALARSVLQT